MENMRFKEGDRVKIKSLDWYNESKDINGNVHCGDKVFDDYMSVFCGSVVTIDGVYPYNGYHIQEDLQCRAWTDEMIEGLAEESDDFEKMYMESEKRYEEEYSKGEYCHEQSFKWGFQEGYDYAHENEKLEISLKNGYEFRDDNGNVINTQKIIMEKKNIKYPKTYEACCKILGLNSEITNSELLFYYPLKCGDYTTIRLPEMEKFEEFIQLYLCRNAYWKLYGEEIGLGKPWEPDWSTSEPKYVIEIYRNNVRINSQGYSKTTLAFPTPEMRDAFYENFKSDIEFCKELL